MGWRRDFASAVLETGFFACREANTVSNANSQMPMAFSFMLLESVSRSGLAVLLHSARLSSKATAMVKPEIAVRVEPNIKRFLLCLYLHC